MSTWVTGTTVVENSTDATNLTSNVTITLIVGWNGGSWAADNPRYYINVNGSTVKSGTANFNTSQATNGSQTIATWTGDVPHNSDGTGSMTWAVGYEGIYANEGTYSTASGTKTLTTIVVETVNRYLDKSGLSYFWQKLSGIFAKKAEVVTSVNGQIGDVTIGSSGNMVLLWTNSSPTSNFAAQTVSLDLSDYDAVFIECNTSTNATTGRTVAIGLVGTSVRLVTAIYQIHERIATISTTGIAFAQNYYLVSYASSNLTANNGYLIPTNIYGLKF